MSAEKRALERTIAEHETHDRTFMEAIGKLVLSAATVREQIESNEEASLEREALATDLMIEFKSHLYETFDNAVTNKAAQLAAQHALDSLND